MHIEIPYVFVNTPDYEGGLESGWALTVTAMIDQLTQSATEVKPNKIVILPHVSMQPIEVEKIKALCEDFGFEVYALPDLSTSLDGYWEEAQGKLANGGITVDEIRALGKLCDSGDNWSIDEKISDCFTEKKFCDRTSSF